MYTSKDNVINSAIKSEIISRICHNLFRPADKTISRMFKEIHEKQLNLTGEADFTYKGVTYGIDKQSINLIAEPIKERLDTLLNMQQQRRNDEIMLTNYLRRILLTSRTTSQVLAALPDFLREFYPAHYGDMFDNSYSTDIFTQDIKELVARSKMMSLL